MSTNEKFVFIYSMHWQFMVIRNGYAKEFKVQKLSDYFLKREIRAEINSWPECLRSSHLNGA